MFFTASKSIPPLGFPIWPTITFCDGPLALGYTCSFELHLPLNHTSYESFEDAMLLSLKCNDGYGRPWSFFSFISLVTSLLCIMCDFGTSNWKQNNLIKLIATLQHFQPHLISLHLSHTHCHSSCCIFLVPTSMSSSSLTLSIVLLSLLRLCSQHGESSGNTWQSSTVSWDVLYHLFVGNSIDLG